MRFQKYQQIRDRQPSCASVSVFAPIRFSTRPWLKCLYQFILTHTRKPGSFTFHNLVVIAFQGGGCEKTAISYIYFLSASRVQPICDWLSRDHTVQAVIFVDKLQIELLTHVPSGNKSFPRKTPRRLAIEQVLLFSRRQSEFWGTTHSWGVTE